MALTNKKKLESKIRRLSTHGITKDKSIMFPRPKDEIWNYQQIQLGFNYRMNDIQAALGLSQMQRLDFHVSRRREIADYYNKKFKNSSIIIPWQLPNTFSTYHLYVIYINDKSYEGLQKKIYKKNYIKMGSQQISIIFQFIANLIMRN